MEMLVIAAVAIVAFAFVLVPLFRRGPRSSGDEREFDDGTVRVPVEEPMPPMAAGPATPVAPVNAEAEAPPQVAVEAQGDEIELEIQRYRVALRAGTVCVRCGQANPPSSAFCFECGTRLPLADAREFE